jgi:pimeloyl-ACP methyl ester carboxylesterase
MGQVSANGITLEYELSGPAEGPVLLMIHGVGAQLVRWPQALCKAFERAGFRTLRFDNRDIGRSTHIDAPVPDIAAVLEARRQGREPELPYTLSDMAADTVGLLDALGIARAHVLGVSLGGMVAQVMAIEHRDRVHSISIFMSQSGNPDLAPPKSEAMAILSKRAPDPREDREGYLRHQVELNRTLGSPDYPAPEAELRAFATLAAERAWNPAGPARQLAAARGAADRRPALRTLSIPALVVHGVEDPLIPVEHGADIARAIKGAWLLEINGMGHDLPAELTDLFASAVGTNCARA